MMRIPEEPREQVPSARAGVPVVYETALPYNLGRLDDRGPLALVAAGVLTVSRVIAVRLRARSIPGPSVTFLGHTQRRWLTLFFVSALAVQYGVAFGTPELAAGAGLLVMLAATAYAMRDALADPGWAGGYS